jgi:two-component system NtrC family response regulator
MDNILVVSTDTAIAERVRTLFKTKKDFQVRHESNMERILDLFEEDDYDLVLVSSKALLRTNADTLDIIRILTARSPVPRIIVLVDPQDIEIAMSALEAGVHHYSKDPINDKELKLLVETALHKSPAGTARQTQAKRTKAARFPQILGKSAPMKQLHRHISQAAATDIPVLLVGETGTGKDLVAQTIHQQSPIAKGPYIPVHLGALPENLIASELFGHKKGAFTGATQKRVSRFEQAQNGTIFLDEISTIDKKVQVSLLRVIEQKKFSPLGGTRFISTNARIITATNQDLREAVKEKRFRQDLFYRLDVFRIDVPPLRERPGDISLLIEEFFGRFNRQHKKKIQGISPRCFNILERHDWPGNIRELKNVLQRAVVVCDKDVLLPEHLPPRFRGKKDEPMRITIELGASLEDVERTTILRTLDAVDNNRKKAAEILGISRRTLYNKLAKLGGS